MFKKLKGQALVKLEDAKDVLGKDFFIKLMEIEPNLMSDHSIFGYFDRCDLVNNVLSEHGFFWDFMKEEISLGTSWDKNLIIKVKWKENYLPA